MGTWRLFDLAIYSNRRILPVAMVSLRLSGAMLSGGRPHLKCTSRAVCFTLTLKCEFPKPDYGRVFFQGSPHWVDSLAA